MPATGRDSFAGVLAQLTALVAAQRRDYDHLAEVIALRDQLADERNITNMQNAKRLDDVDRGLSSTQHVVVALQDRLSFYERSVPSIAAAYKQYQGAMKSEKKRREKVIAEHPEWTDREKLMFRHTGEMPGKKQPAVAAGNS